MAWSLCNYSIHRIGHYKSRFNPLFKIHLAHHKEKYPNGNGLLPEWKNFFLWFGNWRSSLDIVITLILPALLIYILDPETGKWLLAFVYLYEVFCSENLLDHNPSIKGPVTQFMAWGDFHLMHHKYPRTNYGLYITLWDHVFDTRNNRMPAPFAAGIALK